jgi:hypothetical protein
LTFYGICKAKFSEILRKIEKFRVLDRASI